MNILHLKYAVEIAKTGSLNKAAENLYMGQPNLSRAIRELEAGLGITIFERTPRGMVVTPDGEAFLQYAVRILAQIDEMESVFRDGKKRRLTFSLSAPRADYIAAAMVAFAGETRTEPFTYYYKETNALRTIRNVLSGEYNLGIIRFAKGYAGYFKALLAEKGLVGEPIAEFDSVLLLSRRHPLADADTITRADLRDYTEVAHPDPFVPTLPSASVLREELPGDAEKHIFVFERASRFELLSGNPLCFCWSSPVSETELDRYGLVERRCMDGARTYNDLLIHKKEYSPSEVDRIFLRILHKTKENPSI